MIKIGKTIDKDEVAMVAKWNDDKYGKFIHGKVVPPSTAWFDPNLLRSAPPTEQIRISSLCIKYKTVSNKFHFAFFEIDKKLSTY